MDIDVKKMLEEKKSIIDKVVEKFVNRNITKDSLNFMTGTPRYEYNTEAIQKAIADPIWDFLDRGGKRWRPTLFLLMLDAFGLKPEDYYDFVVLPELIHNGTIMVDDIEDMSEERRGKPCSHKIFGIDIAINAGYSMAYIPLLSLLKNKGELDSETLIRLYEIYSEELIKVHFGQAMDIAWHKGIANADNLTEKEYMQMCAFKTGTLARLSARMAAVLAKRSNEEVESLGKFAETIGVAFQIQDDILNLSGEEFVKGKGGFGEDITEGKRSLPVVYTLQKANPEDKKRLLEILNMHTTDQNLRNEAIEIIKKYGSIEKAKEKAKTMVKEAWEEVDKLLPESEAKEKIKAFAYYLIERKI